MSNVVSCQSPCAPPATLLRPCAAAGPQLPGRALRRNTTPRVVAGFKLDLVWPPGRVTSLRGQPPPAATSTTDGGVDFVPHPFIPGAPKLPGVPDYAVKGAGDLALRRAVAKPTASESAPGPVRKPYWDIGIPDYTIRTAAIGAPKYGLVKYSAANGGGGSRGGRRGGSGGGGGGGAGGSGASGSPMGSWTGLFAFLIIVGGLMGYLKKGSMQSLYASFGIAATLMFCASLMADPTNVLGIRLALAVVLLLGGYMGYKFSQSKKPHAGAIAGMCGLMALGYMFT
eukprot:jgi/Tetstr1/429937/TSEL_019800.t1